MGHNTGKLDHPPFPQLTWGDCDWWEGGVTWPDGEEVSLSVTPCDEESKIPSDAQTQAYAYHVESAKEVMIAVLTALRPYYESMRPRYREFLGEEFETRMPALTDAEDLRGLIFLQHVHVHPWTKDGKAYVGLQFGCAWDQEHGLGVMMNQNRVVDLGEAAVSFAWEPDEADPAL